MKLDEGATALYTVTAVVFYDRGIADECYRRIEELRQLLRVTKEFHFSKLSHPSRMQFFEEVAKFQFEYLAVVFDKRRIAQQGIVMTTPFVQHPVKAIFSAIAPQLKGATIVFDKTGSSHFRKTLAKQLKGEINRQFGREVVRKVKNEASHSHALLQLADMVCGAVNRSCLNSRKNPNEYRDMIKTREKFITVWPSA